MKYVLQRFGRIFFESDSLLEIKNIFENSIGGKLTIEYMNEGTCMDGKQYDVFCCKDGYALLIGK